MRSGHIQPKLNLRIYWFYMRGPHTTKIREARRESPFTIRTCIKLTPSGMYKVHFMSDNPSVLGNNSVTHLRDNEGGGNEPHLVQGELLWTANMSSTEYTPNLVAGEGSSSKNRPNKSTGDQIASPYMTWEDELTRIPIKHTMEDARGSAKSCGQSAAADVLALDAKSGAFLFYIKVRCRPRFEK